MDVRAHAYQLGAWFAFTLAGALLWSTTASDTLADWLLRCIIASLLMIAGLCATEAIYRHARADARRRAAMVAAVRAALSHAPRSKQVDAACELLDSAERERGPQ